MGNKIQMTINTQKEGEALGDLFGIFFEDLNHAADGGLYGELIQNRSFEFDSIDHPSYHALTAWEKVESPGSRMMLSVQCTRPIHHNNPHYLVLEVLETKEGAGIKNLGYNSGITLRQGDAYRFSCFAAHDGRRDLEVEVSLETMVGEVLEQKSICVKDKNWKCYELILVPQATCTEGRLVIKMKDIGRLYLDMVSLFPCQTYKNRINGMRKDIAELLEDLRPKFMRFPGGCLVHDGSLCAEDRDSLYRWKNTIGKVEERPSKRNNWGYNQTLGLGFYEYFLLSEDLGAKPLPVLPAGYDPHHQRKVPLDALDEWIQDALDLIEFANGGVETTWGKKRAELGHAKPFNLEYIGIGNEEVQEGFFERYPYFHKAIKEKYPHIKIINTSGPFAAGSEYDRGWESARTHQSDLVDEHYYQAPEWFLAHHHRYDRFDKEGPKVFLGEYASWGNTWYNALVEASYMIGLERNAPAVGLACYAPMLCNVDYVNWKPDMIWFNNHQVFGTANYYVQKLFMNHQGDVKLDLQVEGLPDKEVQNIPLIGEVTLTPVVNTVALYKDIYIKNEDTGEIITVEAFTMEPTSKEIVLGTVEAKNYTIGMKAKRIDGKRGFMIRFSKKDAANKLNWEIGGWQNMDAVLTEDVNNRNSCLTQRSFSVETEVEYELQLQVRDRHITTFINGEKVNETLHLPVMIEPLYYSASKDLQTGEIILKVINVREESCSAVIDLMNAEGNQIKGNVYYMGGYALEAENSFEQPRLVSPKHSRIEIDKKDLEYIFPGQSITIFRLSVETK